MKNLGLKRDEGPERRKRACLGQAQLLLLSGQKGQSLRAEGGGSTRRQTVPLMAAAVSMIGSMFTMTQIIANACTASGSPRCAVKREARIASPTDMVTESPGGTTIIAWVITQAKIFLEIFFMIAPSPF